MTDSSTRRAAQDPSRRRRPPPLVWIALAVFGAALLIAIFSGLNIKEVQGPGAGDPPTNSANTSPSQPPDH